MNERIKPIIVRAIALLIELRESNRELAERVRLLSEDA